MQSQPGGPVDEAPPRGSAAKRRLEDVGIALLFVVAGLAFMAAFVCMASEGTEGMTDNEVQQADRNERTCLLIALPVSAGAGGMAIALDRRRSKRQRQRSDDDVTPASR